MPRFTPTQQKLLTVLQDGRPHTKEELLDCLSANDLGIGDDPLKLVNLRNYISQLRKLLNPIGQDILCISTGWSSRYQQVRMLHHCGDGRR